MIAWGVVAWIDIIRSHAMPREQMDEKQVAAYLHMDAREIAKLAQRGQIPCRKVGGKFVFSLGEVDHWVFEQMGTLPRERLERIEAGVSTHHGIETEGQMLTSLIPANGCVAPLSARTRQSVLRELVNIAEEAGMVYNRQDLLDELSQREELCSTAMIPHVAMPHPRHPVPYDISESFVVVGLTSSGVPYGAGDGKLTRLFFLICCKDDRTHLHVLARLAQILHEPANVEAMLECETGDELLAMIGQEELELGT
jgi:nitrogen PTS system EIIA component